MMAGSNNDDYGRGREVRAPSVIKMKREELKKKNLLRDSAVEGTMITHKYDELALSMMQPA